MLGDLLFVPFNKTSKTSLSEFGNRAGNVMRAFDRVREKHIAQNFERRIGIYFGQRPRRFPHDIFGTVV